MKFVKLIAAGLALGLAATACVTTTPSAPAPVSQIAPNPQNVLDAYVARPDPSFAWKVEKTFTGAGYHGAVLELTSQTWLSDIWGVTVAQIAPIMPYVLLVLILIFRPMGLLGTRET